MSPRRSGSPRRSPARARPRASAPVAQLRRGREALTSLTGQLDQILAWLGDPAVGLAPDAPDRLARTAQDAGDALAALRRLRGLVADTF
jgi:hypothetical protein